MHRFIPFFFNYPSLLPTHGTPTPVVRQLLWNNLPPLPGKQIRPKAFSVDSKKCATSVCPLSGESENNICPTSTMNIQTCLALLKCGAFWWCLLVKSVSGVCSPFIPPLSSNGITVDSTHSQYLSFRGVPNGSWILVFCNWECGKFSGNSWLWLQLDQTASAHMS